MNEIMFNKTRNPIKGFATLLTPKFASILWGELKVIARYGGIK